MKKFSLLILMLLAFDFGFGQVKITEITFESPGGYTTSTPEFTDGSGDYFTRTNGSNISNGEVFFNQQGSYYFGAQDINGDGVALPVSLLINDIDITGYTNLEFRVHLAEDEAADGKEDYDDADYVHFGYDIDNTASFSPMLWIEGTGGFNTAPFIDTNFDGIGDGLEITDTFTQFTENISGTGTLLDIEIVFRLEAGDEDIAIDNIEIWGTLVPCPTTVTWNGTWSGTADLTTGVIINGNYDTSVEGSFQACSLTVSTGNTLTIANNTFVEVETDLTVDGTILVASQGAFVQNDDLGTITYNGTIEVEKVTAPTNNWYEYTAWSSPVVGEDIDNGLYESKSNRRYKFLSENFLDATAETNNNNATIAGQDDIDDNGDDWANVSGTTIMEAGIGYASMHDPAGFSGPFPGPFNFSYNFEGEFNNGVIPVEVYRNDSELNDTNWNFIGNPYPSAIDADLFLSTNDGTTSTADLGGAIFLWSHNTPPASTANGNEQLNFSNNDYAIINGSGETAGGDGTLPIVITSTGHRAIPSGQAFFVGYSNSSPTTSVSGAIATGEVIFNNAMRLTDITANSEFFKGTNSKNTSSSTTIADKLWLDLTSDNGVYNQILIAYVNGATNDDDGLVFDADKYPTSGAALYSTIEGSIKKFAIQGKSSESISEDEIINLGFNSFINVETEYTISIDKLQGDFLDNNTVYLKDDLLDISHNLSDSDYSFTSETGEFKERFQIVFKEDTTLSVSDIATNENTLQIIQLDNDQVNFKTGTSETIKSIIIYDLYGRKLYQFEGQNSSETFRLSNINTAVYIAQVQLSNNAVITKKAIKR
ncbi:T9SS type A sorting domain-containing protein [Algibacter sp. L4_22]|uniref:T9SS type A sorting domain-containing protein n=1 Tax=Algibacter sp. L4_22 TaxID=2942477 RepID=UPI00201B5CBD|nr:T9SS type A sorting domain-containing protein [Algibacter sp. L4_22]MCL5127377.1 T9SS type A sorting domain-containing protein [Algibacter sp. L4_22]